MPIFWIGVGIVALIALMSKGKSAEAVTRPALPPVPEPTPVATTAQTTEAVDKLLPVEVKPVEVIKPSEVIPISPTKAAVPVEAPKPTPPPQPVITVPAALATAPAVAPAPTPPAPTPTPIPAALQQGPLTSVLQPAGQGVATALKTATAPLASLVEVFTPRKITTEDIKIFQRELNRFASTGKFAMLVVDGKLGKNTAAATVKVLNLIGTRNLQAASYCAMLKGEFVIPSGYDYNKLASRLLEMTTFIKKYSASGVAV